MCSLYSFKQVLAEPSVCLYLQVVEALLEAADEVGNLIILCGQRVGDLTQRFLQQRQILNLTYSAFCCT